MSRTLRENRDKILVVQLLQANEAAFEELYEKYKDDIYTYAKSLLRSEAAAEEIVQEVFLKLWMNSDNLNPELSLKSFLFTITRNLAFDFLRKAANDQKLKEEIFYRNEESHDRCQQDILDAEYEHLRKKALSSLPPKRRLIFEMSRIQGMSYEDISRELGISVSTVKTQMSKALFSLRKYLLVHTDLTFFMVFLVEFSNL